MILNQHSIERNKMEEDKRIVFKLGFECKCGEKNADKFILNYENTKYDSVTLLCATCEKLYSISISSREIIS